PSTGTRRTSTARAQRTWPRVHRRRRTDVDLTDLPETASVTLTVAELRRLLSEARAADGPEFVSTEQAAALLGKSPEWWQDAARAGRIPGAWQDGDRARSEEHTSELSHVKIS